MQESGFACDAALARRRRPSLQQVSLYPRLRHSPAILPLPRPTCTLHFQAPVVLKLPGHPSPHTVHHSHGSSRLQLLPSPSPFHRSPFHAHTHEPTAKHLRCFFWLLETLHERLFEIWYLQSLAECLTPYSPPRPARRRTPGDTKFEASVSGDDLLTHARPGLSRSGFFMNANVFPRYFFNHVRGAYGR